MQNILRLFLIVIASTLISCATYRNGQTPDDIYYASEPTLERYITTNNYEYRDDEREDRMIRMRINNRQFRTLNDPFCNDPYSLMFRNNDCFCVSNSHFIPLSPINRNNAIVPIQPSLSSLSKFEQPQSVRVGKFTTTPRPSNGSTFFRGGSNQMQTRYSSSMQGDDNSNNGSRFFQNNSSPAPSGSFQSSGSTRSGRRN